MQYGVNGPHNFFADYDRHGRGTCTIAQFRAAMMLAFGASYMKTDLTEKECQLLEEHYARTLLDGEVGIVSILESSEYGKYSKSTRAPWRTARCWPSGRLTLTLTVPLNPNP